MNAPLTAALTSAAVLGFRHGLDYDHVAAITDITSLQRNTKRAMRLGLLYALGHAFTVAALGSVVILFQLRLSSTLDRIAERLVGLTLIVLGLYVSSCLVRGKHNHLRMSRLELALSGFRWLVWKLRCVLQGDLPRGQVFPRTYDIGSAFAIGMIHGIGAETPTQIVVFLLAASLGGLTNSFLGLGMFLMGLLGMNTLVTACATGMFRFTLAKPVFLQAVTYMTAAYSLSTGIIFLFGASSILPPLGGQ